MGSIDFDYVVRLRDVWQDNTFDVNELHTSLRVEFQKKLEAIHRSPKAPIMGWPIIGSGGSGKTHLLGQFRRMAIANHSAFVLVDMTDVRDVWETLLQGYLDSLQRSQPGTHSAAAIASTLYPIFVSETIGRRGGVATPRSRFWDHSGDYQ